MPPETPLRLLHVEDSEFDHALLLAQVAAEGVPADWHCVQSEEAFLQALEQTWDAVICDHHLPGSSGLRLLALLRERDDLLPFLLVSGQIGEELAVEAMRCGASDYLLKRRLARFVPALLQAIRAAAAQRERAQALRDLQRSRAQLAELTEHLQQRIEAERAQLSRELHDDVGSQLTALKFDLAWLQRHGSGAEAAPRLAQALELLDGAIAASRRLMQNLRPPILEEGVVAALQWLVQGFERQHAELQLSLQYPDERVDVGEACCLVAYRFVQEALSNVAKHAQARRVRIELQWASGVLGVEVEDDGCGLRPGALEQAQRFGLRGLRERAEQAGGWVDVSSRAGRGTLLALNLPIPTRMRGAHPLAEEAWT